jgi:hypothetical protein
MIGLSVKGVMPEKKKRRKEEKKKRNEPSLEGIQEHEFGGD